MDYEKQAGRAAVLSHARNLARSGLYADWKAIEAATQGLDHFRAAERWFGDLRFRSQLNQLCALAQKGHTGPRGPRGARVADPALTGTDPRREGDGVS